MNVGRLPLQNLEAFGEYTMLYFEDREVTNLDGLRRAAALAAALAERGVSADDRVVVMMPNNPDVMAAFQAVWRLGAVIVPVTPQLGPREVRYMLADSAARVVITSPILAPRIAEAAAGLEQPPALLVLGPSDVPSAVDIEDEIARRLGQQPLDRVADRNDDQLALLLYTSGTTGAPKGVMLSHGNLLSNVASIRAMMPDVEPFERFLHVLPLSHSYGVLMMNLGYEFGAVAALLPHFETRAVFEALERYRVQRFSVVPTMLSYMLDFPERDRYDLSHLTNVSSGGSALPNEVRFEFERVFDCEVRDGYGMSESAPSATGYRSDEAYRPGSVGRAIEGVEVTIRDDDNRELPRGETGEICIKGPNVMLGYWNKPEATAETLIDGWLHSGDVGRMDEDGYVYITDRKKDLIIKGAENISPREIEEVLYEHPSVGQVAVIGLPHPTYGEEIAAVIAPAQGCTCDAEELRTHCAGSLTRFKLPSRFFFLDDLPKNGTGKIMKRELRERFRNGAATEAAGG